MAGLNRASIIGHLGKDPEVRRLNSGAPVVNLSIATSESWRDKQTGEKREKTEWHRIVIYQEKLCEIAEKYLRKGSFCMVEGKLQTRKWQDQSGVDKYSTEIVLQGFDGRIVLLGSKGGDREEAEGNAYQRAKDGEPGGGSKVDDLDDEIPFAAEWR